MITTRLPAALYAHYGQHLAVWVLARLWDDSFAEHEWQLGSGRASFLLSDAAEKLNRSVSTIRRWLAGAKAKGLLRFFKTQGDECVCYYASLERIARAAGLEELGAICEISLTDIRNLRILSTEAITQQLQRASYWAAKEEKENKKLKRKPLKAELLFGPPCENLARVLGRKNGILYVSEGFITYGASQKAIALQRGTSTRTVQRHLSNQRTQPSPVRGYRSELGFCYKAQIAQRVRRGITPKLALLAGFEEDALRLIHGPHDRIYFLRTNVYYPDRKLVRARYRRRALNDKAGLSIENGAPGEDSNSLAIRFSDKSGVESNVPEPKESLSDPATPPGE